MANILVVLTNTITYGEKNEATGLWLGEATEFVEEVQKNGHTVEYISPKGGYVPLDPRSMNYAKASDFSLYGTREFKEKALSNSKKASDIISSNYDAIYFTGGHGVMWDFPYQQDLQRITREIYEKGGYVSSVCHGIAGLLNVTLSDGAYLIHGKKITGFTTMEEILSGKRKKVPFLNETVAGNRGAKFKKRYPFATYAIEDSRIITGQNPQSAEVVAKLLVNYLK